MTERRGEFVNPVRGYTMLRFLEWLVVNHPEIHTIRGSSKLAGIVLSVGYVS